MSGDSSPPRLIISVCLLVMSSLLLVPAIMDLTDYRTPIDGLHAAQCSFLSVQDHGSTECRYCKE